MSLFKRGEYWWCDVSAPSGKRIRRSLGTQDEQQAKEVHDKIRHEMWRTAAMGDKPRYTFAEAAVRWIKEHAHKKSLVSDIQKIAFFRKAFGSIYLDQITGDLVRDVVAKKQAVGGRGSAPATINRHLALMRSLLRAAEREWCWIDKAPAIKLLQEPKRRIRWLTQEEAQRLLSNLPEHWMAMALFALSTGLRKSNITGLKWSQIDMSRRVAWIHPDQAKGGRAIGVPLNDTAITVIRDQIGKHAEFVFSYKGAPVHREIKTGFLNGLKKAGIENFRFHDLRHTWASWLVQSGVGLTELQELGGWESVEMVRRYAHLAPDHLRKHANVIDSLLTPNGTFTAQQEKRATLIRA